MSNFGRVFAVALVSTALVGCATTREATEEVAGALISVEEEQRLGAQMAVQLEQEVELLDDPVVQDYVASVGQQIVASAPNVPEGTEFRFRVIDAPDQVNAVTLPGGYIYVYSGLLRMVDTEAELAAVLAHEVAHVADRHVAAQLVQVVGLQTLASLALGEDPSMLARLVASVAATGSLLQFSRDAEREADRLGVLYTARGGWDPGGYVTFFQALSRMESGGNVPTFLRSHPAPAERVANARENIAELSSVPSFSGSARYRSMVARLD